MSKKPNKLINEKSPYLLQHAYNPVEWFPWCDEAFEKAKKEDKPIFLSIGYSTCHWCHIMEKESFEDEEVAKLMNETFVSIKVDREERPDIDGIYMTVCQMITGSGGWPLTIIMTPEKKPFFAGTYFPKRDRFGRIGMLELIPKLNDIWKNRRQEVLNSADEITNSINKISIKKSDEEINENILNKAFEEFLRRFDKQFGGFGNSPKFPTPHNLLFLLRYFRKTKNSSELDIV
ncbi:MAG: thioredoxin domain-containing protein, partial [Ignavibacterium sp.]